MGKCEVKHLRNCSRYGIIDYEIPFMIQEDDLRITICYFIQKCFVEYLNIDILLACGKNQKNIQVERLC